MSLKLVLCLGLVLVCVYGKTFDHCDLARTVMNFGSSREDAGIWVCIAFYESSYKTDAVGPANSDGSQDYGIFQINNRYWCSPEGTGCGIPCTALLTDDIDDDYKCAAEIKRQTGFQAWTTYEPHCNNGRGEEYLEGCGI